MARKTDPAREYTDLCARLRNHTAEHGAAFLAAQFEVEAWSTDFMLILASIHQQASVLEKLIDLSDLDADIKDQAHGCLSSTRQAFSASGLSNAWQHSNERHLNDANVSPLRVISGVVRRDHGYEVPEGEELDDLISDAEKLRDWLLEVQSTDRDFIRAALIEGLSGFLFRIKRVGWFGWAGTNDALKAVVAAYLALERSMLAHPTPQYEAMVKRTGALLKKIFDRVKFAKDAQEVGDWLLRGYGAMHVVMNAPGGIAGLLTSG